MTTNNGIAGVLAAAARDINQPYSVEDTLKAIVNTARNSIPGFDAVGISLVHRDKTIETKAAAGDLVFELDSLQYSLGEGPCVSWLREEPVVVVEDFKHAQRWPRSVPHALALGLKAQMGLRLYVDDEGTLGCINLYSTGREDIDAHAVQLAEVFAAQAAATLGKAQELSQLQQALKSRETIGQASVSWSSATG